jgi:DNA-binding response OmpR family regulator
VLRVFLASRVVVQGGVPVRLTRREFDLLAFFCDHPRQVFDRQQLLRQVWGYELVSGERTVDVHVRRLRIKLGGPGPLIATVRGVGYRLDEAARVAVVAGPE